MRNRLTATFDFELALMGMAGLGLIEDWESSVPSKGELHVSYRHQELPLYDWEREMDRHWSELDDCATPARIAAVMDRIQRVFLEQAPWLHLTTVPLWTVARRPYANLVPRALDHQMLSLERVSVRRGGR
jgi:hypothetical protein